MPVKLTPIRCLEDNYAWLVSAGGHAVLVDAPEAGPILATLDAADVTLDAILLTHHHDDHVQAAARIIDVTGAELWGNAADARRLPPLDRALTPGEDVELLGEPVEVIDTPGHTVGHVAFHWPRSRLLFTADSLMAMGCGRLFEGTPAQMWDSLTRLAALPDDTLVCSGHDYCRGNGAFALSVDAGNAALRARIDATAAGQRPCSPATLADEKATNPFLRAPDLARPGEDGLAAFTRLRREKDSFRG